MTEDDQLLVNARDILLPGMYPYCEKGLYDSDILIDFTKKTLVIIFYSFKTKESVKDEITLEDIKDGSFKGSEGKFKLIRDRLKAEILDD